MNTLNLKKFFVAGTVLVMMLGLSACHYGHGHGRGYSKPSHAHAQQHDGGRYDRRYRRRGDRH
jgi:hypothetical protein